MKTETTTSRPIFRGGMSISSADWGMTSKPTNRNGTAPSTATNPTAPPVKCGCRLAGSPPSALPPSSRTAMRIRKHTTQVWTSPASFTPRMLIHMITSAAMDPVSAQVRWTSKPVMLHRRICSSPGKM